MIVGMKVGRTTGVGFSCTKVQAASSTPTRVLSSLLVNPALNGDRDSRRKAGSLPIAGPFPPRMEKDYTRQTLIARPGASGGQVPGSTRHAISGFLDVGPFSECCLGSQSDLQCLLWPSIVRMLQYRSLSPPDVDDRPGPASG